MESAPADVAQPGKLFRLMNPSRHKTLFENTAHYGMTGRLPSPVKVLKRKQD